MTWEDELEADFIETDPDDIYGFFKSRITSLLKKHRDNILNQFTDMEGTIDIPLVISLIKSAPKE